VLERVGVCCGMRREQIYLYGQRSITRLSRGDKRLIGRVESLSIPLCETSRFNEWKRIYYISSLLFRQLSWWQWDSGMCRENNAREPSMDRIIIAVIFISLTLISEEKAAINNIYQLLLKFIFLSHFLYYYEKCNCITNSMIMNMSKMYRERGA